MRSPPEPLELLRAAVSVPSPSGAEGEVAALLVEVMAGFCEQAFVDEVGNAVGVFGRGPRAVTFLGHIDTVAGEVPVRLEGGRLYGRGSVDAKGAFCTALCAAARLEPALRDRLTLRLIGAVEEEAPTSRGARHALERYPRPDLLVIGEPSGWDTITLGYKGRLVVRAACERPNFHSAGEGITAAESVVDTWLRLRAWAEGASGPEAGPFDRVQATLQEITSHGDGLRQRASATVGLRLPPAWPPEAVTAAVGALELAAGVNLEFGAAEVPVRGPRDTPLTRAFRTAIREVGGRPRSNVKTGTSDMNVVARAWDVPMLAYGPGDSRLDHTPDEHLEVGELDRAVAVLATALSRLG